MSGCILPSLVFILVENIKGADKDSYHEQQSEKSRDTGSSDGPNKHSKIMSEQ